LIKHLITFAAETQSGKRDKLPCFAINWTFHRFCGGRKAIKTIRNKVLPFTRFGCGKAEPFVRAQGPFPYGGTALLSSSGFLRESLAEREGHTNRFGWKGAGDGLLLSMPMQRRSFLKAFSSAL
jgi:hypothetical protein